LILEMTLDLQSDFRTRNGSVDAMRLIASAGIVWFHAGAWGKTVSYAALSLFIVFLIVLPLQRPWSGSVASYAWDRANRLLRPWVVWSLIYAALKIAQAVLQNQTVVSEFNWTMMVIGTMTHLWFLPFGFACSVTAFWFVKHFKGNSELAFASLVALAAVSVPASTLALNSDLTTPFAQWCYGLPAVFFAMAIHFANFDRVKLFCVIGATALSWLLVIAIADQMLGAVSLLLGVNLAVIVLAMPTTSGPWTQWAANVSMPVYLAHPIFLSLVHGKAGFENGTVVAIAAIILSMALGSLILRLRWARWLT
jgi:peptidoglycan/LPS O-acetylase OafA/YrhL